MSDLRIALVAEGPTDKIVIEAFLSAILDKDFVLTLLQPESLDAFSSFGKTGGGWCGVVRWCKDRAAAGFNEFDTDPAMKMFDFLIIHIDGDVADKQYADCGINFSSEGLPLHIDTALVSQRVERLRSILCGWLGVETASARTIFCIPHLSTEAWVVACLFPDRGGFGDRLESTAGLDRWLSTRSREQKLKKTRIEYSKKAEFLKRGWHYATEACSQASRFQQDVETALGVCPRLLTFYTSPAFG
jgi:hypothetical protein